MSPVAVVTDSTAYLPAWLAGDLTVVPLTVVVDGRQGREGIEVAPDDVTRALLARPQAVTTSRPAPAEFIEVYGRLLDAGHAGVLSVHLSSRLSGTATAAALAAAEFGDRVRVLDSGSVGMGLGFPALAAVRAAATGADLAAVSAVTQAAMDRTTTLFCVETLEFLRRGGRIGAAAALLGTALAVKPILRVSEAGVQVSDRVRTLARALDRLVDLAVDAADGAQVDVVVHHLAAEERAAAVAAAVARQLGDRIRQQRVTEVGAAVGAHAGPGLVGVVVHRLDQPADRSVPPDR